MCFDLVFSVFRWFLYKARHGSRQYQMSQIYKVRLVANWKSEKGKLMSVVIYIKRSEKVQKGPKKSKTIQKCRIFQGITFDSKHLTVMDYPFFLL